MMTATQIAREQWITPRRCRRCRVRGGAISRLSNGLAGTAWTIGYDDGRDPNYVGYQCKNCGNIQGLTRATVLRRAKAS